MGLLVELFEGAILLCMAFLTPLRADILGLIGAPRLFCLPAAKRKQKEQGGQDNNGKDQLEFIHTRAPNL